MPGMGIIPGVMPGIDPEVADPPLPLLDGAG